MMTKNQVNEREQLEMLTIDQLVPEDESLRRRLIFLFLLSIKWWKVCIPKTDVRGIGPVVLFKMIFIQYIFGIRSMRQTIKEIETNMAYHWFLGFGFHSKSLIFLPSIRTMYVAFKIPMYLKRFFTAFLRKLWIEDYYLLTMYL